MTLVFGTVLLVLFWLKFVDLNTLQHTGLSGLYDIENQGAGYHNVKITATIFTVFVGILNVGVFTQVRIERLIRQKAAVYFLHDVVRVMVICVLFVIWFYGIDTVLLWRFLPKELLFSPAVITTLILRVILATGYYLLASLLIYLINLYTRQFGIALFATSILMLLSLKLCLRLKLMHPLSTIDTFQALSIHGLDVVPILQGVTQLLLLLILVGLLNVWKLRKCDFL